MAAARLADGCVRLLRSRPPEILFCGASVSHDVKCLSVGQRLMSVPISESRRSALYGPMPSICERSAPVSWWQRRAKIESRFVVPRLLSTARGRQGRGRCWRFGGEVGEVCVDGRVARGELPLIHVVELEILLKDEDVFGAIVPGEGRDDLRLRCAAPIVAMLREMRRVAATGHDVTEDSQTGHARDIADDQRELDVHLDQGFLHALHEGAGRFNQGSAVAKIAAQRDDSVRGAEAAAQQAEDVQVEATHNRTRHSCGPEGF